MEVNQYVSNDGLVFENPIDCASHELKSMKDFVEKMNVGIGSGLIKDHWCNANICGCMGCVNIEFMKNGLSEYHYLAWKRDYLLS